MFLQKICNNKPASITKQEAREIGNVGAVYLAMGDFDRAVDCHMEHLKLATSLGNRVEEARAYSNLGSSHHYKRNFEQATFFHEAVLKIALELKDRSIEARAHAGLGHAARCTGDIVQAKQCHQKQLEIALQTKVKAFLHYLISSVQFWTDNINIISKPIITIIS